MRDRGTRFSILLAAAVAFSVAALFVFHGGASSSQPSASPQSVAQAFAGAYVRYLDGEIPVSRLPDADAGVLQTAGRVIIPARLRTGQLTLAQLDVYDVSGAAARAGFGARDERHYLGATIALAHRGSGWEVVGLVPSDMSDLYAPPKIQRAPSAAQAAASNFVLAYVDYRAGVHRNPPGGLPLIVKQIADRQDPLARTTATHKPARLVKLELGPVTNGSVSATASLVDGPSTLTVLFIMQKEGGLWTASQFILSP